MNDQPGDEPDTSEELRQLLDATPELSEGELYELPPGSTGAWRITTGKSIHVINLAASPPTYQRIPSKHSKAFDTDAAAHHLTRVELWPRVGWRFVFRFQDPTRPHEWERWHATSPVQRIESIDSAEGRQPR
jgi:hypothetical protein